MESLCRSAACANGQPGARNALYASTDGGAHWLSCSADHATLFLKPSSRCDIERNSAACAGDAVRSPERPVSAPKRPSTLAENEKAARWCG